MPEYLIQQGESFLDPNRIPFVLLAILITFVIGIVTGPRSGNCNPAFWLFCDVLFGKFGDRMDKVTRARGDLVFRGFIFTVFLIALSYIAAIYVDQFVVGRRWVELIALCLCMTGGSVWYLTLGLYFSFAKKQPHKGMYYALSRSTRLNLNTTDDYGIVRESISYLAYAFDKGVIAPAFWYLVGGLPLLFLYCVLAMLAWRFGKCGQTKGFGAVANELEKIMGFAPALFTGLLYTAAIAITPTAKVFPALRHWFGAIRHAPYMEGGYVLSALSWGLGIVLGGAAQDLNGSAIKKQWIGASDATAKLDHNHIKRALYATLVANFLFIFALLSIYIVTGNAGI